MHYSNGNYEAFVNASKPKDVDQKSAYIVGSGLAAQDGSFGHPDVFCKDIPKANWRMSATITIKNNDIVPYIEAVNKKDPHSGSIVTSGPTTIKDSTGFLVTQSVVSHTLRHKSQMN